MNTNSMVSSLSNDRYQYLCCLPSMYPLLNIGSIRIYILTTGVVSNETNTYVRMYIEEFILVDIWIHCCTKLKMEMHGKLLVYIHSQQRTEKCENCS